MRPADPTTPAPSDVDALFAQALNDHGAGRLSEADAAYRQVLALRPDFAEAHNNLGIVHCQQGQIKPAIERFERALALRPDLADAHNNLGNVLGQQGDVEGAVRHYERAVALQPNSPLAHHRLGMLLRIQGQLERAAAHFQQALALKPDLAEAHNDLGVVRWKQEKLDEAAAHFDEATALRPDYAEAHNNLGSVLWKLGKPAEAASRIEQALALRPDLAAAHKNLGSMLAQQDQIERATAHFQQALASWPNDPEIHYSLGKLLLNQGRLEAALEHFTQALAQRPDYADARFALATCYLLREDYAQGWPAWEARLGTGEFQPPRGIPRWAGQSLAGRSLLLVAEQGLGDTIQFVRYARVFQQRGARVVLAAQRALGRLLKSGIGWDALYLLDSGDALPGCDFYLPLMSAPYALFAETPAIPRDVPYLAPDAKLVERWRSELAKTEGFKIGIAWQGSRDFRLDRWRSMPLAHFAPLARLPGVRLVSLQKGFGAEQIGTVDFPVVDLADRLDEAAGPFVDTAAVIAGLDLVVTSDTSVAHLAGALGGPVWVALQFMPDWRFLLGRDDSPWYPSMRLFRQRVFADWGDVFERIAATVQKHRSETA